MVNGLFKVLLIEVDDSVFNQLKKKADPAIQKESSLYIGLELTDDAQIEEANDVFKETAFTGSQQFSQLDMSSTQKQTMGLTMFIVGFLGLTFLVTSGCILYFKQMDESEQEKAAAPFCASSGLPGAIC